MIGMDEWNPDSSSHHLLELLEIDASVAVDVDGADHLFAILEGALLAEAAQHGVQLAGGDLAVLILVVQIEGLLQLLVAVATSATMERLELLEIDESVTVSVQFRHYPLDLILGGLRAEAIEDGAELA